jgi:hypothetical protein
MRLGRLRSGELLVLAGAACVIVSLFVPSYEGSLVKLNAWDTFGPGVVLLLAACSAALALVVSALTERTTALPVAVGVWCVVLALPALAAAIVRVLQRPDHTDTIGAGAWLALAGSVCILAGAWQSLRDEHTDAYQPIAPPPRPRP